MSTPARPAEERHEPVLARDCVDLIAPALTPDAPFHVDATLGMAGHAQEVLQAVPHARLIGIDRDDSALELARDRLTRAGLIDRVHLVHTTYDQIPEALADLGIPQVSSIIMDLGVSSYQIDTPERGFSYSVDAPLDMRMDPLRQERTAAEVLADSSESELARILREWGDERWAGRIAKRVVQERDSSPLTTSAQLVDLIDRSIPAAARRAMNGHPAKRTFQALRMAVNEELPILASALKSAASCVRIGGRLVVESYHSGEDRLVKSAFAALTRSRAPEGLPVELAEHQPTFRALTRGAIQADLQEQERNARSRSVRLRAVERIRPDLSKGR